MVLWGEVQELLRPGQSCLLPATLGTVTLEPLSTDSALLKAYVPDLVKNIVVPLRQAGIPDSTIADLGGRTSLNPISAYL